MKQMTLCADDFGQSPEISKGILELLDQGRLQAVSCMTESPYWPEAAARLRERGGCGGCGYQAGLHFNLTHPFGQAECSVGSVMAAAWLRRLDPAEIEKRFNAQWLAFTRELGRNPDYVDGHQHVHAFPQIREIVAERVKALASTAWVRTPAMWGFSPKTFILSWASKGLARALADEGLATNPAFGGLRPYRPDFDFRAAFRQWLAASSDGTLLMCHPGHAAEDPSDPIADCRPHELAYLASDEFQNDCREMGVVFRMMRSPA